MYLQFLVNILSQALCTLFYRSDCCYSALLELFWGYFQAFGSTMSLMLHSLWFHLCCFQSHRNVMLKPDVQSSDPAVTQTAEHGLCVASFGQGQRDGWCLCVDQLLTLGCIRSSLHGGGLPVWDLVSTRKPRPQAHH